MIMYDAQICGQVLFDMKVDKSIIDEADKVFKTCPELSDILSNPTISKDEKYAVIDKLFPEEIRSFLKIMTEFGHINKIREIFEAYYSSMRRSRNILEAELFYVNKPDDETVEKFRQMLKKKYSVSDVLIKLTEDRNLIGGYKLVVGDMEYDKSVQGTIKALQNRLIRR